MHDLKVKQSKFKKLNLFLNSVFKERPDSHFNNGGPRASSLKFRLPLDIVEIQGHEISQLAYLGLEENKNRFKQAHPKVQNFLLENDDKTMGVEIPIWLESSEIDCFNEVFKSAEPMTGHIDVLRVNDGKIWVWDYKPNAHKEKYASTQVYFYALMLSKRTGIPLEDFRCGYFDHSYAYIFKPEEDIIRRSINLKTFL